MSGKRMRGVQRWEKGKSTGMGGSVAHLSNLIFRNPHVKRGSGKSKEAGTTRLREGGKENREFVGLLLGVGWGRRNSQGQR